MMIKIIFVCHGNICRSPMAEFVLKSMVKNLGDENRFEICSAATSYEEIGNDMHRGTKEKLREMNIPFERRSARRLTKEDYADCRYIIGMDRQNITNIMKITGGDPDGKVKLLPDFAGLDRDIADPWYTGDFGRTYEDIELGCRCFLQYLQEKRQPA